MKQLAENLWLLQFELKMLGADLRRNVTVIRLLSGDLVIHSTGPFSQTDVAQINILGRPTWVVDVMLRHDTFAREGRAAFPLSTYLAPEGFSKELDFKTQLLLPAPAAWRTELDVLELAGAPSMKEHLFLHRPSRTLIVADLVFNFGDDEPFWTEMMLKVAVGGEHHPGMPRPFKAAVKDEAAFLNSMDKVLAWDFDRIVVGHGDVIETGGQAKLRAMLEHAGYSV